MFLTQNDGTLARSEPNQIVVAVIAVVAALIVVVVVVVVFAN